MSRILNRIVFVIFVFFGVDTVVGQNSSSPSFAVNHYPVQFNPLFLKNNVLINPAASNMQARVELNTSYSHSVGSIEGINSFFVSGGADLNRDSVKSYRSKNILGITFFNEKEGPVINRNRGYVSYARHQRINPEVTVGVGFAMGFAGYAFSADNITGGSDYAMDGNAGVTIYSENLFIGLSINQILNNELQPIQYRFNYSRYYNFIVSPRIDIDPAFYIRPTIQLRWLDAHHRNIDVGLCGVISDIILAGVNYKYKRSIAFSAGLNEVCFKGRNYVNLFFTYQLPMNLPGQGNIQTMEITLNYWLR